MIGKLERKVQRAEIGREGRKARNADWSELNERIGGRKGKSEGKKRSGSGRNGERVDGCEDENEGVAVMGDEGQSGSGVEMKSLESFGDGGGNVVDKDGDMNRQIEDEIS